MKGGAFASGAETIFPLITGAVVALGGVICMLRIVSLRRLASASRAWPAVQGEVVRSESIEMRAGYRNLVLMMRFRYEAKGQTYEGSRAALYGITVRRDVEDMLARFPVGAGVWVYYNPKRPRQAVLIPGWRQDKPNSEYILCVIVAAVGATVVWLYKDAMIQLLA